MRRGETPARRTDNGAVAIHDTADGPTSTTPSESADAAVMRQTIGITIASPPAGTGPHRHDCTSVKCRGVRISFGLPTGPRSRGACGPATRDDFVAGCSVAVRAGFSRSATHSTWCLTGKTRIGRAQARSSADNCVHRRNGPKPRHRRDGLPGSQRRAASVAVLPRHEEPVRTGVRHPTRRWLTCGQMTEERLLRSLKKRVPGGLENNALHPG